MATICWGRSCSPCHSDLSSLWATSIDRPTACATLELRVNGSGDAIRLAVAHGGGDRTGGHDLAGTMLHAFGYGTQDAGVHTDLGLSAAPVGHDLGYEHDACTLPQCPHAGLYLLYAGVDAREADAGGLWLDRWYTPLWLASASMHTP